MKLKNLSVGEKFILRTPGLARANTAQVFKKHNSDFPAVDPRKKINAVALDDCNPRLGGLRQFPANKEVVRLKD